MGDIRRIRKKTSRPSHPWRKERIEEETKLVKLYGLKNKGEIWKAQELLRTFYGQAKNLLASTSKQAEIENIQLMNRIYAYGLLEQGRPLEDVLTITVKDVLDRRLQTLVHKKEMARSVRQSRQFITHEHILVNNKKINAPGYLIKIAEETVITFSPKSQFANPDHPERAPPEEKAPKKAIKKEEKGAEEKEPEKKEDKKPKKSRKKKEEPKAEGKEEKKEEAKEEPPKSEEPAKEEAKEEKKE